MSKLASDYYERNPLSELVALRQRVAALERALTARPRAGDRDRAMGVTLTTPDAQLPTAADFPPLHVVDEETRFVYRLVARRKADGRETLSLRLVGRLRPETGTPPEDVA